MGKQYKEKEIIKAFEIVEEIISNSCQMISHFYSGDKDTRFEAMSNILKKHNLPDFNTLSTKELGEYHNKYYEEVKEEFTYLVNFGKEELVKINNHLEYIKQLHETYKNYDNILKQTSISNIDIEILSKKIDSNDMPF